MNIYWYLSFGIYKNLSQQTGGTFSHCFSKINITDFDRGKVGVMDRNIEK